LDELKKNLIDIYNDINEGLVPDTEPFQLMDMLPKKACNELIEYYEFLLNKYNRYAAWTSLPSAMPMIW